MVPDQIFPIDVGPGPIILFRRRISPLRRRSQSQMTLSPTKYLHQTLRIPRSPSGLDHLCRQMPRLLPTFPTDAASFLIISGQCCSSFKYFQPTPGISNPSVLDPQGLFKIFTPGLPPTLSLEALAI